VSERPETDDEGIEQDSGEAADDGAGPRGSSDSSSAPGTSSSNPGPLHAVLTRVLEVSSWTLKFSLVYKETRELI
jgi:hypothetical protein